MLRVLIFALLLIMAIIAVYGLSGPKKIIQPAPLIARVIPTFLPTSVPIFSPSPTPSPKPTLKPILSDVPFTVQAPFANWKDPRQQDACEEAAVLMVMHWVKNEPILNQQAALDEILKLSYYQEETYGVYHDTSAKDTADRLIKGYYKYSNYEVKDLSDSDQIISALNHGGIVIVPTNGQALGNPNFTQPGPERHMLVIKSYVSNSGQFITNDPGISQGQNWSYNKDILYKAIRDYPTGDHLPIVGMEKRMIVVKK